MVVRRFSPDDLPAMAAVYRRAVMVSDGDLLSAHPELARLDPPADGDAVFVADIEGRVIGFATAGAGAGDDAVELKDLFVDPDHQRSGVGRALVDAVVEEATRTGRLRIEVDANPHAAGFYHHVGFRDAGVVEVEFGTGLRMVMAIAGRR